MDLLLLVIGFIAGVIVMLILYATNEKPKMLSGKLKIDFSHLDNNICELELCEDLNSIYTKQYITLLVETKDFSQK